MMYCSSCKKEVPSGSSFCLHCGARVGSNSSQNLILDYQYSDFVYEIGRKWTCGKLISLNSIAQDSWRDYQETILPKVKEWVDQGWEPVSEVGPAAFVMREEPLGCLVMIFDYSRFEMQRHIHVERFRVKMRKRKT